MYNKYPTQKGPILKITAEKGKRQRQKSFFKREMHVLEPIDSIPLDTKTTSGLKKKKKKIFDNAHNCSKSFFRNSHEPQIQPIKL